MACTVSFQLNNNHKVCMRYDYKNNLENDYNKVQLNHIQKHK